jgi:hypothetical protein
VVSAVDRKEQVMTANQVVAAILDGEYDGALDGIDRAIRRRKKEMFRPGTRVRVAGNKAQGEGVVTQVHIKRIGVTMDDGHQWLVPASMLEVIA